MTDTGCREPEGVVRLPEYLRVRYKLSLVIQG